MAPNGIGAPASDWRKASRSVNGGACVEVARDDAVLVRDSVNPSGLTLCYPAQAWQVFLAAAKTGTFTVHTLVR
jgi:hypothetical protein